MSETPAPEPSFGVAERPARSLLLAEATRAFAESDLDLDATLASIARLIAEEIGDGCSVRLLDDDGHWFTRIVVQHRDPAVVSMLTTLFDEFPQRGDEGLFHQAFATGEVVRWTADTLDPAAAGMKPEHIPVIARVGVRDLLIAPLLIQRRRLGIISVWRDRTTAAFADDDAELLRELARQASVSVEHARLYRESRAAEQTYRELFDAIPEAAWVFDLNTLQFLAANETAVRRYGYSREEFLSMRLADLRLPEDIPTMMQRLAETPEEGPFSLTVRHVRKDGSIVVADLMSHSIHFEGRRARLVVAIDVTERRQAEEQLRDANARYRMLVDQMPGVVYLHPPQLQTGVSFISPAIETLLGYSPEEFSGDPDHWTRILHPEDRERVTGEHHRGVQAGKRFVSEYRNIAKDGRAVWVRDELMPVFDESGDIRAWHGVMVDITVQREAEEALRHNERRFASLVQHVSDIVAIIDLTPRLLYVSPAIEHVLGYPVEERDQLSIERMFFPDDWAFVHAVVADIASDPGGRRTITLRTRHADGSVRVLELRLTNLLDDPSVAGIVVIGQDITERRQFEEQLERQAFYDSLTALPNRALFLDRLRHAIAGAARERQSFAVLFLDVDDFKVVNDSLGHAVGDDLLIRLADRLGSIVRPVDTIARFAGDEFTVLLDSPADRAAAELVAERIILALSEPFELAGRELYITTSIGIVVASPDCDGPDALLRDADVALYRAKAHGKASFAVFDQGMRIQALDRLHLEHDLRQALEHQQLELHFQQIVDLATSDPIGFEALLRWRHPRRGLILPEEFLRVAEETGLIIPIGEWVLREACRRSREWRDARPGSEAPGVTVNLSAQQFSAPQLATLVARTLDEAGLQPCEVVLEITETTMMDDIDATIEKLQDLKRIGVGLAIDDFGAGYSSLAHLKHFPVDYLKIDRSFIAGLGIDAKDTMMVSGMIAIAHALGLRVVAEGVETDGQREQLLSLGCDLAQGYYFHRPAPAAAIPARLAERMPVVNEV